MDECPFCRIIWGGAPATVRARWLDAIAIEPLNPVTGGHTLIIPIAHVADFAEWPDAAGRAMRRAGQYAVDHQLGDCNVITSKGPAATQTVEHMHLHIVPRAAGDRLALPWTGRTEEDR